MSDSVVDCCDQPSCCRKAPALMQNSLSQTVRGKTKMKAQEQMHQQPKIPALESRT